MSVSAWCLSAYRSLLGFSAYRPTQICCVLVLSVLTSIAISEEDQIPQQVLDHQKAAVDFVKKGDIPSAVSEYDQITSGFPGSEYAYDARSRAIGLWLKAGQRAKADTALEALMSAGSKSVAFREAVHAVGASYRWAGDPNDPAKGREVYNRWLDTYGDDPESYKIQCGIVKTYFEENNIDGANSALERFKQLCSGQSDVYPELAHLAGVYEQKGHPEKALQMHQWFITEFPEHEKISESYTAQILCANNLEPSKAQTALDNLMSTHPADVAFRKAVLAAGAIYRWGDENDPAKGRKIYNRWLEKYSDDPESYKIQVAVVKTYLEENDMKGANAALERFKQLCAGRVNVYPEASHLAYVYQQRGYSEKSQELYQWLADGYLGQTEQVLQASGLETIQALTNMAVETARAGDIETAMKLVDEIDSQAAQEDDQQVLGAMARARVYVYKGSDTEITADVGQALETFKEVPELLSEQLFYLGEEYYLLGEEAIKSHDTIKAQAYYTKAIDIWGINTNQTSDLQSQCLSYYYSAISHQRLDQDKKAITCFQQVLSQWPDYEKAWHAQYMIAKYYEQQAAENKMSVEDVRAAYQIIVEQYPTCSAAKIASKKINTL